MKSAEEWAKEYNSKYTALDEEADRVVGDSVVPSEHIHEIIIKQIQLDAMKEGARRAAKVAFNGERQETITEADYAEELCSKAILTTAEQWTEKDL